MSTITPEQVKAIAALSRLALTDEEVGQATKDLSGILDHFSAIGDINTTNVPPADDASGLSNITREDIAKPNILCTPEELLERAPKVSGGYVQVPGVFEDNTVS